MVVVGIVNDSARVAVAVLCLNTSGGKAKHRKTTLVE